MRTDFDPDPTGRTELKQILGVTFGIAVTIGGMIGLGILRSPGVVAANLSSIWIILLVWVLGGLYSLFGVFSVAELGVSIPRTGGWYSFARRAFGEYAGFTAGYVDWIAYPATLALTAITFGEYFGSLFPFAGSHITEVATASLIGVTFVNYVGLRSGSRFQEILSFSKAGVFAVLVIAAFLAPSGGDAQSPQPYVSPVPLVTGFILSLQAVIYTYDGWYSAIYFSEETKDRTNIPRSMIAAVVLVAVIYLAVNGAVLYVLPHSELAASALPVAEVADRIFGAYGNRILTALALVTLLSLLNANLLTGPRILFALSRDGLFSDRLANVNSGGTPANALLLTSALSVPFILTSTFDTILAVSAFLFIGLYLSGFLAVVVLRYKEPDMYRPYKSFGYPWTTLIVIIGSLAFLVGAVLTDTLNAMYAIGLIILSVPLYYLVKRTNSPASGEIPG